MRRRISAIALTAALAGGALFAALPAQTATAAPAKTCKPAEMRHDISTLRSKAQKLKHLGEPEAARRANAQADALQRQLTACENSERTAAKRWS
ncbi:hypothetical protein [Streptomyces sp. NPDC053079]|uniref:hypothetical protein n=1 Tax=Streptomyces sp. NPDC053079 TaxID=3365697 RepID=UPI0037D8502C